MRQGFAIAFFISMVTTSAIAQQVLTLDMRPDENCHFQPEKEESCVKFFGCFVQDGVWFSGTSRGWNAGQIDLTASDGETCTGVFSYRSVLDMGKAELNCSSRDTTELTFFNRGDDLNVVTGTGVSADGQRVQMWAGERVADYIAQTVDGPLTCGDLVIELR